MAFSDIFFENRQAKRVAAEQERNRAGVQELLGRQASGGPADFQPGAGLLSDPQNIQNQVAFAGGLEALNQGGSGGILSSLFQEGGRDTRSQATLDQSEAESVRRSETTLAGQELSRLTSQENAAAQRAQQQGQFDQTFGLAQQGARTAAETAADAARQRRLTQPHEVFNPFNVSQPGGGRTLIDPKQQSKQQGAIDTVGAMTGDLNEALALVEEFGTEFWNDEARGQLGALRSGLLLRASGLRGAGAPQAAELELNAEALPDPNSFGSFLNLADRDRMVAAYDQFGNELRQSYLDSVKRNPSLSADLEGTVGLGFLESRGIDKQALDIIEASRGRRLD